MSTATATKLTVKSMRLDFQLPPSMNREPSHWAERYKLKELWMRDAFLIWYQLGRVTMQRCTIKPIFYFPDKRRRDTHNYLGGIAMKGLIDGLVGHLIPDDDHTRLRWLEPLVLKGPARMILEITEDTDGQT